MPLAPRPHPLAWARRTPVALLVLGAVAGVALGQGMAPIDERSTTCWPCHVAWKPPLKSLVDIVPPHVEGAPGDIVDYTVQVSNPWLHDIVFLVPSLDLAAAPSLKFFDGRSPVDEASSGSIDVDPTQPGGPHRGHVVIEVPQGATDLVIQLAEQDPFLDVDVQMWLYPGSSEPNGTPALVIDDAGPGQPETYDSRTNEEASLAQLGAGNWTVQAVAIVAPSGGVPNPVVRDVPFRVDAHIEFNANEETTQYLAQPVLIGPGQSHLVTWRLQVLSLPATPEAITLRIDAAVHYTHLASSQADDDANITKSVVLNVADEAGRVVVTPGELAPRGRANVVITVTMTTISEAVGYASAFLLVFSVWTGGMFGRASRRQINAVFGTAKRRVAFHNFLSYGLTVAALAHTVLFIIEKEYHWTLGLIWGSLATLSMLGLGLTGALQVPMIRRWSYGVWRWSHLGLTIAALLFSVVHLLLDGAHFGAVQDSIGWVDPLDRRGLLNQTA